jgi:hypothetical protein
LEGGALADAGDDSVALAYTDPREFAELLEHIHEARMANAPLLRDVIDAACRRFPSIGQIAKTERIECLLDAGALAETALALIDLELPQWQVRRIAYDGGEWYCALSRERELPDWLDQAIEGRHEDLALAILAAFVEVQSLAAIESEPSVPASGRSNSLYIPLFCDDIA